MNKTFFIELALNFIYVYEFCLFLFVIFSFFPKLRLHPLFIFLGRIVEPSLIWARKILPRTGMIDLSPVIVYIFLSIVKYFLLALS